MSRAFQFTCIVLLILLVVIVGIKKTFFSEEVHVFPPEIQSRLNKLESLHSYQETTNEERVSKLDSIEDSEKVTTEDRIHKLNQLSQ